MKEDRWLISVLMLLLGTALAACSSASDESAGSDAPLPDGPEGTQQAGGVAIGFDAMVTNGSSADSRRGAGSSATRTDSYRGKGEWTTETLRDAGFGVYCWYTAGEDFDEWAAKTHIKDYLGTQGFMLMQNQLVSYDATGPNPSWTYSPAKYWPLVASEKLTLRAYAPFAPINLVTHPSAVADRGTPYLPVVVKTDDFCNDRQQDPLWGTSDYVDGTHTENHRYGSLYNNFTLAMSGSELTADARDGTIDWYFHHGMTKIGLEAMPAPTKVFEEGEYMYISYIRLGPLYTQGLLDIFNSKTENEEQKPTWQDRDGNGYVELAHHHANAPGDPSAGTHDDLNAAHLNTTYYTNASENGLLIIPRDFTATPLEVTIRYVTKENGKEEEEHEVTGKVSINMKGNTIYVLRMVIDPVENTVYITPRINLDWQVGAHNTVDGL